MYSMSGGCHCGNIRVDVELARAPGDYNPRACDCDFCRKHAAAYVSDQHGRVRIRIEDVRESGNYRQGSGQADCLLCRRCGVLIGALFGRDEKLYAAVNVNIFDVRADFGAHQPVSPRTLSEDDKVRRWQEIWFSDVLIARAASAAG